MDMKPNRITEVEDNLGQPVFWQTPCCTFALLLCRSEVVLIVSRCLLKQSKQHSFAKVSGSVVALSAFVNVWCFVKGSFFIFTKWLKK